MVENFLDVGDGLALQHILGDPKQKDQLISFLTTILDDHLTTPIQDISSIKVAQDSLIPEEKQSSVEIHCQDQAGEEYIVRVQMVPKQDAELRICYHASQTYINQVPEGCPPHDRVLKPVIFVALTDFVMFPDDEDYKSAHCWLSEKTKKNYFNHVRYTILELPKFWKYLEKKKEQADT